MKTYSWKSDIKHRILEFKIKELDKSQDMTRSDIINRAISKAIEVKDWNIIKNKIPLIKDNRDIKPVTAMQVKVDDSHIPDIENNIIKDLGLESLKTGYLMKLLMINYLESLKSEYTESQSPDRNNDISNPEMMKIITEMIILDREIDKEYIEKIKDLLLEYSNKKRLML